MYMDMVHMIIVCGNGIHCRHVHLVKIVTRTTLHSVKVATCISTSFPARIPQVSMFCRVLEEATSSNLLAVSAGK